MRILPYIVGKLSEVRLSKMRSNRADGKRGRVMLTIWTNKIKHSTVGSSFSVTFSVAPNELEYLNKLYDCFSSINWSSFPITTDRKTEPQTEMPRCSVNGTPFDECGFCEYFNCDTCKCEADVTQMERSE